MGDDVNQKLAALGSYFDLVEMDELGRVDFVVSRRQSLLAGST